MPVKRMFTKKDINNECTLLLSNLFSALLNNILYNFI